MRTTRSGAIRLFSGPLSMFGAKAQIAVLEKGLDFELVMVPFEVAYDPKHPEVLRINPKRQVPVLRSSTPRRSSSTSRTSSRTRHCGPRDRQRGPARACSS
jgi:hypothetical protein